MTDIEKLMNYVSPEPMSGCWLWTGGTAYYGYGTLFLGKKQWRAHRASFMLFKGPIPKGMSVCHKCDVPPCVNPDHLFLGTHSDNMRDMLKKGRGRHSKELSPTCRRGHSRELFIGITPATGYIYCKKCQLDRKKEYEARKQLKRGTS